MQRFALALLLLLNYLTEAQPIHGRYEGAVSREGSIQLVSFDFFEENGVQKATYEIPDLGLHDVPVLDLNLENNILSFQFYYGNFTCHYEKDKEITGKNGQWNPAVLLHVKKAPAKAKPYTKQEVTFNNKNVVLSGVLLKPRNTEPAKYVVLIHGSGDQYRETPYYISLGHLLTKNGFGVLLYDKRGVGKSGGNYITASFDDLAGDAIAGADYLRKRKDLRVSKIGFLGTSQGGWLAPIAANKMKNCDFVILNVGPSVPVFEQEIHRVKYSMLADRLPQTAVDSATVYNEVYFRYARDNKDKDWKLLEQQLNGIRKAEWAQYLSIPENKDDFKWWRNNNYDPKENLQKIKCPVLALMGEKDPLVPPAENELKMKQYLGKAGVTHEVVVIKGCAHDMKTFHGLKGGDWNFPDAYWEWKTQPEEFMQSIVSFLHKI